MAQFEEVLGGVRLALTWACPAEIQALLEGLVEERIISEAYSKSLSLHRLIKGIETGSVHSKPAWEAGSDQINSRGPATHQGHLGQVWKCGSPKSRESAITCDDQYSFRFNDEITELLRGAESVQKMISDNERIGEGNSDDEKEWLETVEEVARKIAVPLWQHWDRGQRMLLPLVSCMMTGCAISESTTLDCEAQCPSLNMEEETELTTACRTLDLYSDNFHFREAEDTDTSFTLDTEGATDSLKGLCLSAFNSAATAGLNMDHVGNVSPVEACTATDTSNADTCLEGHLSVCCLADGTTDTTDDLMCLAGDTDAGFDEDDSFYSKTDHSIAAGVLENLENVFRTAYGAARCSIDSTTDFHEKKEEERVDPHWGAKMHEVDQDQFITLELEDLPDDLSEFMKDDYLPLIDTDVLFGDVWLNGEDSNNFSDVALPTELPCTGSHQQRQKNKVTGKTNSGRKRKRATTILKSTRAQRRTDENTPSKPKKRRPADKPQGTDEQHEPAVTQSTDTGLEQNPAEAAGLTTTPPRILHLHPPIQFIFPDSGYVQTLRLSPPVIGLPLLLPLLVPAASTPCKRQVQPPSPVDGAVAPVQMSSSPPGSMSDTASKAMPPLCNSPGSPSNEMSPCKEPPLPQSPTVLDIPQVVQDYIQKVKAHMSQTCQDMEEGLTLSSHYVDMQVSRREILRSGKSANKCLDKELINMGDTDRQKSLLRQSQIFEGSNGDKSKHCILLLGNAGMGKTTLIRKLCLDWSIDCIPQFDFVFLLDGKALTLTKPTFSLQTLLLNLSSFAPSCMDPEAVYAQILAAPKRVLIVFDGFDQLRDYESLLQTQEKDLIASLQKDSKAQTYTVRQLYSAILQRVLLPGCTLLLATRPRGTASQLLRRADSFLEVCGFSPTDVETYLSQYFTDPALRASALDWLKNCTYLHLLCWNPGLCRLVCLVLEQSKSLEDLPRTLTGLCHQVLRLKMDKDNRSTHSQAEDPTQISLQAEDPTQISLQAEDPTQISLQAEDPTQISLQAEEETQTQISSNIQTKRCHKNTHKRSRVQVRTRSRTQRTRRAKEKEEEENEVDGEEMNSGGREADRTEERELLSQLSSLAWEGVKANSSILPTGRTLSDKLKAFGLRMRLFLSHPLRTRLVVLSGEGKEGGTQDKDEVGGGEKGDRKGNRVGTEINNVDANDDYIVLWANPFLQSYLAGVHLSLSRTLSDRNFLQTLPFQSGPKGRRRPQREELELTQRFTVGLLFHKRTELQRLHSNTETSFRNMVVNKQALVTKHLEGLSHGDLSPAQVLEACHYVYEANFTHSDGSGGTGSSRLVTHLAANLPEVLTFHGVPLNPPDVFTLQNVLERGGTEGRSFCLDLEDSGIQVSGLRALVGLKSINTYRACIADVITLWEQLEQSGEEGLLRGAVSKLNIHPLKATQVCHVEHLAKLVNIHMHKRLTDSCSQSDSILAEGVPAVKELHKLEFELGPEKGPLGLPKLWELLPGLQNLQHLDLENSKIGDKGAEKLADALASLCSLEILNLSQNCIGDNGVKKLASTLSDLPKLHCLSLYSNVISDEGAESLAAVLPHMASLTELDVKYNKLTDVGAQSLGASLRKCQKIKTLRMWNQCIPYGVFERLQQQDSRILWH